MSARTVAATKRWRERHKRLGLCVECKEPARPGRRTCQAHADRRNRHHRERYAACRKDRICYFCGRPLPADETHSRHFHCRIDISEWHRTAPGRRTRLKRAREKMRERRREAA